MKDNAKAKIFLAADRGHTETEWFRSYNTFNFGGYVNEHKMPFGGLYVLNDDTLAGGKSLQLLVEEDSFILLLPNVGVVTFLDGLGRETLVDAGESGLFAIPKNTTIQFTNPYAETLINFFQLWFKAPMFKGAPPSVFSFDIDSSKNKILPIIGGNDFLKGHESINCFIGKFDGRKEEVFKPASINNGVFILIIEGAFEVQNRLLEARDGLAIWNVSEIEFEALSNEAIILFIEVAGATY